MRMNATELGRKLGTNAQETNRVLKKAKYLEGEPGNYTISDKAKDCANVVWSKYNKNKVTIVFDEEILNDPLINESVIKEVKAEMLAEKIAKKAAATEKYIAELEEKKAIEIAEKAAKDDYEKFVKKMKNTGKAGIALATAFGIGYSTYKVYPHIKKWCSDRFNKKRTGAAMDTFEVVNIIEEDFGCEGVPEGHTPECIVLLKDSKGEEKQIIVADEYLYKNDINVGDCVRIIKEELKKE